MTTGDERVQRYAEAMTGAVMDPEAELGYQRRMPTALERARRAMAVADAEQAELRAYIEREGAAFARFRDEWIESGEALVRKVAALEDQVERVVALCDLEDERTDRANERLKRAGVVEPKSSKPFRTVGIVTTRKIRAALDGGA